MGILSIEQNQGSLNISDRLQILSLTFNRKVNCDCNFQVGWPWKHSLGFLLQEIFFPCINSECQTVI